MIYAGTVGSGMIVDRCAQCQGTGKELENWRAGGAAWTTMGDKPCRRCRGTGYVRIYVDDIPLIDSPKEKTE